MFRLVSNHLHFLLFALPLVLASCAGTGPFFAEKHYDLQGSAVSEGQIDQRILLIGDAGKPAADTMEPALGIAKHIWQNDPNTTVVYLGDNIYSHGMPEQSDPERPESERRISEQVYAGNPDRKKTWFIPGNHDWNKGHQGGWAANNRQETFVDSALNYNGYLPDDGCPGPVVKKVGDDIALVLINTQWWLHKGDRPEGDAGGCEDVKDEEEFLVQLEETIKDEQRQRTVVLVGHHPLRSNGSHGGYYTFGDHLFPLKALNDKLFIPLPGLGSIYPGYRKYMGNIQDLAHPRYRDLTDGIEEILEEYPGVVYASGHEHNLQYHEGKGYHHIVSGSGSKVTKVAGGRGAEFAYANKGLCEVLHLKNGEMWVRYRVPDNATPSGRVVFEKRLGDHHELHGSISNDVPQINFADSSITVHASDLYKAGAFKRFLFGEQYRTAWAAPITVPVLDVQTQNGGLTPVKRGGGMATKSLRFDAGDGHQYVTRSIEKNLSSVLPSYLRNTVALGLIQDGTAASHPYAAITVAPMADALGVFHTNPSVKYVPNDPALGVHQQTFGNMLVLYENRPEGDQSTNPDLGNAEKVIGTPDLIEKVAESHYNEVDQEALLLARLFDNVLGDWDRHDDQWRWARYPTDSGFTFKPIPRDRDQVYHKFKGLIPDIINSNWAARNLRKFDYEVDNIKGQNYNARYLDRSFLTEMDRTDFVEAAVYIQKHLTDQVIHEAVSLFPDTIYKLDGPEIEAKLRSRRDLIVEQGQEYYDVLAKKVDVTGSMMDEYFEVRRMNDLETSVAIFPIADGTAQTTDTLYYRVFLTKETKEVCVYGIGGTDEFDISGTVRKGLLVRMIGGVGSSAITANDKVMGWRNRTKVYSAGSKREKNNVVLVSASKEVKDYSDSESMEASYDRKAFKYNTTAPVLDFGYNADDGIFIGGGIQRTDHGFLKDPYKSRYRVSAKGAFLTGAWSFNYSGSHKDVFGKWDFFSELSVEAPNYLFNFYGLGNESVRKVGESSDFYRFELNQVRYNPTLQRSWNDVEHFRVGPTYQYVDPLENRERFPDQSDALTNDVFDIRQFLGVKAEYHFYNADNALIPQRGMGIDAELGYNKGITVLETEYVNAKLEVKWYTPLEFLPKGIVLAVRGGASHIIGDFEVYQAATLSGYKQFRGVRRDRYAGRTSAYGNAELRFRLFSIGNNILPFDLGGLAHYDVGRVWYDNEDSDLIHTSYGFGGWIGVLDKVAIQGTWSKSDDDELFTVGMGFFF